MSCPCCGTHWCHESPVCSFATPWSITYGGLTATAAESIGFAIVGACASGANAYRPYKYLFGFGLPSQARVRASIATSNTNPCQECTVSASFVFDIGLDFGFPRAWLREAWEYSATTTADGSVNNPTWTKVSSNKDPTSDLPPGCREIVDAAIADAEAAPPPEITFSQSPPQRYCLTQQTFDVVRTISQRPFVQRTFTCSAKSGPYGSQSDCTRECTNPLP